MVAVSSGTVTLLNVTVPFGFRVIPGIAPSTLEFQMLFGDSDCNAWREDLAIQLEAQGPIAYETKQARAAVDR